jgi:nitrite reductase/ring-hydroxylating ferredoxin subunit
LSEAFPERLQAWYRVCGGADLRPGQVLRWDLPGRSFAVWRGRESGRVYAVAAHCAHMGTHLAFGDVTGDALRCPLHHWQWGGDGGCQAIPGGSPVGLRQRAFPVAEVQGSVFLFNGPVPRYPAPELGGPASEQTGLDEITLAGTPVRLRCPWVAVACNGFDMQHMQTVHGRALRSEPSLQRLDAWRLRMRLESRVTGRGLEDRAVQWLSRDHVRLTVTCSGGTVVAVESDLGRVRSGLLLCLRPIADGVEVTPVFAVPRGRLAGLRVRTARALFSGFIRKDVAFMNDMRFHPSAAGPSDPVLQTFLDYLRELPADEEPAYKKPEECADTPAADPPPRARRGGFA